jgi:hypothetical protein
LLLWRESLDRQNCNVPVLGEDPGEGRKELQTEERCNQRCLSKAWVSHSAMVVEREYALKLSIDDSYLNAYQYSSLANVVLLTTFECPLYVLTVPNTPISVRCSIRGCGASGRSSTSRVSR